MPPRQFSHADVEAILRSAGYSTEDIRAILERFPDPIAYDRGGEALFALGISLDRLTGRMGGSP